MNDDEIEKLRQQELWVDRFVVALVVFLCGVVFATLWLAGFHG